MGKSHKKIAIDKEKNMGKAIDLKKYAVPLEKLRWICPQEIFKFECTTREMVRVRVRYINL